MTSGESRLLSSVTHVIRINACVCGVVLTGILEMSNTSFGSRSLNITVLVLLTSLFACSVYLVFLTNSYCVVSVYA